MRNWKRVTSILILCVCMMALWTAPAFAAERVLQYGNRGEDVKALQTALIDRGYLNANATGYFGHLTLAAVKNYQQDSGLVVDGKAGPKTMGALNESDSVAASAGISNQDLYWLARIIEAEAKGEPYEGKVAVGNVVMNRVKSGIFPNTVYGVVFQYTGSVPQFSPVANGTIYNTPQAESVRAAEAAYGGVSVVGDCKYFFNPSKAKGTWIVNNCSFYKMIANHAFYR
ncbi:cell wall hydrolase [Gehongia tenuis]|uniref:Cell wall hydrolase n=1 Tax=Gehongia tenuis TaxID=2763655 RepID=A0A926D461_9FIRM|nr:cell wall hydrolase [Gehongia tenuis]MBC8531226.1 cell wall hydrolase [Gehongia tenuis]